MGFTNRKFNTLCNGSLTERIGYGFDYLLADNTVTELYVYKNEDKAKPVWYVIDPKCGQSVCCGATRAEAVAKVQDDSLRKKFTELVNSPRYKALVSKFEDSKPKAAGRPHSEEPEPDGGPISLDGEHVCITGTLPTMTRNEAHAKLREAGGIPCERFTSKVTMLVVAADSGKGKREKAEKAIAAGQEVRIVNGSEFVAALNAAKKEEGMQKEPKAKDETAELKARIEQLEAELAKAKAPVDAATVVSLTELCRTMQDEWCPKHPNTCATFIPKEKACVKVYGVMKANEDWQRELDEMGFRWAGKKGFWYYGEHQAKAQGKVAVIA